MIHKLRLLHVHTEDSDEDEDVLNGTTYFRDVDVPFVPFLDLCLIEEFEDGTSFKVALRTISWSIDEKLFYALVEHEGEMDPGLWDLYEEYEEGSSDLDL